MKTRKSSSSSSINSFNEGNGCFGGFYGESLALRAGLLGKMVSLRLETILVGEEGDGVELTVGSVPADGAADDQVLVLGSCVFDLGFFCPCDSVARFVAANQSAN